MKKNYLKQREQYIPKGPCTWWVYTIILYWDSPSSVQLQMKRYLFPCQKWIFLLAFIFIPLLLNLNLSTVFLLFISSTTLPIRYLPSRYNTQIPVTYKNQNDKQILLWILYFSSLLPIFIFISTTSRITIFSTYNLHFLNSNSLFNPTKHGILHNHFTVSIVAKSPMTLDIIGHSWLPLSFLSVMILLFVSYFYLRLL